MSIGDRKAAPAGYEASGSQFDVVSPVTGERIQDVRLWTADEMRRRIVAHAAPAGPIAPREVLEFLGRLKEEISRHREQLVETTILETGFIAADSREIVDGAIEFLADFELHVREHAVPSRTVRHSYAHGSHREMRIVQRPFRCVAAVVPQNASFTLAIIVIASALYAGCRVVLRPSLQCSASGTALAELVERSRPPEASVLFLDCLAEDFVNVCCEVEDVQLIHYVGSNRFALSVFLKAFEAKKTCLMDGQGNGLLYVDSSFPIERAVELITSGATRFNGETCTSVNGVLVEPSVYPQIRDALVESLRHLKVGNPSESGTQVGPLFSERQARELALELRAGPSHRVLCGGDAFGAYFTPAVVEGVTRESSLAREGCYGPALWIQPVDDRELFEWLRVNRFPLSDTILSARPELVRSFALNSRAARITVNEDPSVESMFEPWGGYPPSGLNPVSIWIDKYRQAFQVDGRIRDILSATGD